MNDQQPLTWKHPRTWFRLGALTLAALVVLGSMAWIIFYPPEDMPAALAFLTAVTAVVSAVLARVWPKL